MFTKKVLIPVFMFAVILTANVVYSQDTQKQPDANVSLVPPGGGTITPDKTIDNSSTNENSAVGFMIDEKATLGTDDGTNTGRGKNNGVTKNTGEKTNTNTNGSTDTNNNR